MNNNNFGNNMNSYTGNNTSNPFGNFNPMSGNNYQMMQMMSKFNQSYQPPERMLEKIDHTNNGNLVHNNINENTLDEHIVEYKIHIDSADRDPKHFKDPFNYIVSFNAISNQIYKERKKDGTLVEHELKGSSAPFINKEFKNVKYVKMDSILLPRYTTIYDDTGYVFDTDSDSSSNIYDDRFVILRIDELHNEDNTTFSTNINTEKSFGLIYPDKLVSKDYYFGTPFFAEKHWKNSNLGNISKLSIKFLDSYGNQLKLSENTGTNTEIINQDPLETPDDNGNFTVSQTDLRHPLNKRIQNHMTLIIGVVESQINTETKFSN